MLRQLFMQSFATCFAVLSFTHLVAQETAGTQLEKMPAGLESDFARSALPPHLRMEATVYLLDPQKGFYVGHQGSNGFICFVSRTEWEWSEFRKDLATPISYDAEGAKSIFPVYKAVAEMRASGKFTPAQIKDTMISRINRGVYKAPAREGVSYMLAPLMRVYPGLPDDNTIVTVSYPHYMFYAPYITHAEIGFRKESQDSPMLLNPASFVMGEKKGPHGYIIFAAGEAERKRIISEGKDLMKRLMEYKPWFKVESQAGHH
jgi:hypothetical protein